MSGALRILARIACVAIGALAVFVAIVCFVLLIHPDKPDERLGAAVILVGCAAVIAGCVWAWRRTRGGVAAPVEEEASSDALDDAERRVRAGETVVLNPSRRRTILSSERCCSAPGLCSSRCGSSRAGCTCASSPTASSSAGP